MPHNKTKESKLEEKLAEVLQDGVYTHIMEKHWHDIETFRFDMEQKIEETAKKYAKIYVKELLAQMKDPL